MSGMAPAEDTVGPKSARNEGRHAANLVLLRIWRGEVSNGGRGRMNRERALEELLRLNSNLVWHIVARVGGNRDGRDDLHAAGMVGLLKGIERYDEGYGCTLATYASWWIKQAVGREMERLNHDHRLGSLESLEATGAELQALREVGGVEEAVEANLVLEEIEKLVEGLGYEEREVLRAWMRNDGNLPAAARETDVDQTRARQRLYSAWSKLQHPTNRHSPLAAEWESAACRGENQAAYFPGRGRVQKVVSCGGCAERERCLAAAMGDQRLLGVWGGTGEGERKRVRRTAKDRPSGA